jgi:hypothetical protein
MLRAEGESACVADMERAKIRGAWVAKSLIMSEALVGGAHSEIHDSQTKIVYVSTWGVTVYVSFWLTIQNKTNRHVSNAFGLLAVFISFPLVRAGARWCALVRAGARSCAPPTPLRPPFWGEGSTKKRKLPVASALALGHVRVGVGEVGVACNSVLRCRMLISR